MTVVESLAMATTTSDGWDESAAAWIASLGEAGDFGRCFVLDAPMLARLRGANVRRALDVGCGEGRFCRLMRAEGIETVGIDPTRALVERATQLDPFGDYRIGRAEALDVDDAAFDAVVGYLSLIDIADLRAAVAGMVRALRPGGAFLIANLTSFNTAGMPDGWTAEPGRAPRFCIDRYLDERAVRVAWAGISIDNWHRPLETYMTAFLDHGLQLTHFAEPAPYGGGPERVVRYRRVPWFHIMEWRKPL